MRINLPYALVSVTGITIPQGSFCYLGWSDEYQSNIVRCISGRFPLQNRVVVISKSEFSDLSRNI